MLDEMVLKYLNVESTECYTLLIKILFKNII